MKRFVSVGLLAILLSVITVGCGSRPFTQGPVDDLSGRATHRATGMRFVGAGYSFTYAVPFDGTLVLREALDEQQADGVWLASMSVHRGQLIEMTQRNIQQYIGSDQGPARTGPIRVSVYFQPTDPYDIAYEIRPEPDQRPRIQEASRSGAPASTFGDTPDVNSRTNGRGVR